MQTLQNTVTQQGKDITAANSAITKLTGDLSTTNANVSKKADASALCSALQNTVTQQGSTLTSQGSSLTQLNSNLSATQGKTFTRCKMMRPPAQPCRATCS